MFAIPHAVPADTSPTRKRGEEVGPSLARRARVCRMSHVLLLLLACAAAGCGSTVLYSNVSEQDANEMMAALLRSEITCSKIAGQEGMWTLTVSPSRFADAVEALRELGYPRDSHATMGAVFQKSGLVSSPTEERIRFVYALSEELSATLSRIDGVVSARVHIVLPNNNPFGEAVTPSSASVFIKHRPSARLETLVPQIKELVSNSIEGLSYDKVTAVLFEASDAPPTPASLPPTRPYSNVLSLKVSPGSVGRLWGVLGGTATFAVVCLAASAWVIFRQRARQAGEAGAA